MYGSGVVTGMARIFTRIVQLSIRKVLQMAQTAYVAAVVGKVIFSIASLRIVATTTLSAATTFWGFGWFLSYSFGLVVLTVLFELKRKKVF